MAPRGGCERLLETCRGLYWIALESQTDPLTPSSLQVLQGKDGNNNEVFRSGSLLACLKWRAGNEVRRPLGASRMPGWIRTTWKGWRRRTRRC